MISVKELYRGLWEGYAFMPRKKNTAVSQFLPGKKGERVVERAFFYPALGAKRGRPSAWICLDRDSGRLENYSCCFVDDFVKDDPYRPEQTIDYSFRVPRTAVRQAQLMKRQAELYKRIRKFAFCSRDQAEEDCLWEFLNLLEQTVPEGLKPYYRALSPEFFQWAGKAK